jgi:hypothetical protein
MNTNSAIMRQLMRTARMLEAEWRQVLQEVWVWEQRKMSQVLGTFELLDFAMIWPFLAWWVVWNSRTIYLFNFPIFFWPQ